MYLYVHKLKTTVEFAQQQTGVGSMFRRDQSFHAAIHEQFKFDIVHYFTFCRGFINNNNYYIIIIINYYN